MFSECLFYSVTIIYHDTYDVEEFMLSFFNNTKVLCFAFPKINIITYSLLCQIRSFPMGKIIKFCSNFVQLFVGVSHKCGLE